MLIYILPGIIQLFFIFLHLWLYFIILLLYHVIKLFKQKIIPQAIPNQAKLMNHQHLSKMYPQFCFKVFAPS